MSHWYKSFKGRDGSINTFEWSFDDEILTNGISIIVMLLAVLLFALALPALAMLVYPSSVKRHKLQSIIVGVVAGIYFLIDYMLGWMFWNLFHEFETFYTFFLVLNTSLMIIFVLLYFYDDYMVITYRRLPMPSLMFFVTLFLIFKFIFFPVITPVIKNIGHVEKKENKTEIIGADDERIRELREKVF